MPGQPRTNDLNPPPLTHAYTLPTKPPVWKSDRFTCREFKLNFVLTGRAALKGSPAEVFSTVPRGIFKPPQSPFPCSAFLAWSPHLLPASHLNTGFIEQAKIQGLWSYKGKAKAAECTGCGCSGNRETGNAENFSIASRLSPSVSSCSCIIKEQGRVVTGQQPVRYALRSSSHWCDWAGQSDPGSSQKSINVTVI